MPGRLPLPTPAALPPAPLALQALAAVLLSGSGYSMDAPGLPGGQRSLADRIDQELLVDF